MTSVRTLICLITLTGFGGLIPSATLAQTIVWADQDARKIQRKDVNGGSVQTIVQFPSPQFAQSTRYDPVSRKLYYRLVSGGTSVIQRSNLDGSNPETIPISDVGYFTINIAGRKLHWTSGSGTSISSSELDGTGIISHTYSCCVFTLEGLGDRLFFGAGGILAKGIWRADADGSNEQYMSGTPSPIGLTYDPVEDKIYVGTSEGIYRTSADGSDVMGEPIGALDTLVGQVKVEPKGRKLYWVDNIAKTIRRSNLDGSNVEAFVTAIDVGNPNLNLQGLTIVDAPAIPATSAWGPRAMMIALLGVGLVLIRNSSSRVRRDACGGRLA